MSANAIALRVATSLRQGEGPTALLDIVLDGAGEGWARISMVLTPAMLNGYGSAHGGMLFLLADAASPTRAIAAMPRRSRRPARSRFCPPEQSANVYRRTRRSRPYQAARWCTMFA